MSGGRVLAACKYWCFGTALVIFASAFCPRADCQGQQVQAPPQELRLSLKQAVELAFSPDGNAVVQLARLENKMAAARSREAMSALLPNLDGSANLTDYITSFAEQGFTQVKLPFGLQLPQRIGPIDAFDLRSQLSGNIFDFSAIRRFQASRAGTKASRDDIDSARQNVAAQVARQYMAVLRGHAEVEAADANVRLAGALLEQAKRVREAGNGIALDVTRAQVELADEEQRLQAANGELREAELNLLRSMRVNLDTPLYLTDKLEYVPVDSATLAEARAQAKKQRPDLRAEMEREHEARLGLSAAHVEHVPSILGYANYGTTGNLNASALPTYTLGLALRVPFYDGGRQEAQVAESATQLREERVRVKDLNDEIDLEVRVALERLDTAEAQFKTAQAGLELAQVELDQTSRRYAEGVAGSIEVTDAQTKLARAQDNRIAALFGHNVARIDLNYALGSLMKMIGE